MSLDFTMLVYERLYGICFYSELDVGFEVHLKIILVYLSKKKLKDKSRRKHDFQW